MVVCKFYVFFTNGVQMKDGKLIGPSKSTSWRCAFSFVFCHTKNSFPACRRFTSFRHVFNIFRKSYLSRKVQEVFGSRRPFPTYSGPFPSHLDRNRLQHNYYKNPYKDHHNMPYSFGLPIIRIIPYPSSSLPQREDERGGGAARLRAT